MDNLFGVLVMIAMVLALIKWVRHCLENGDIVEIVHPSKDKWKPKLIGKKKQR